MAVEEVVIVEDDRSLRFYLEEVLGGAGYRTKSYEAAEEALEHIDAATALVLTDLRLPGISGAELIEELKRRPLRTATVLMTAYATEEMTLDLAAKGVDAILAKPFTNTDLLAAVENSISETRRLRSEDEKLRVERMTRGWVEITSPSRQEYLRRFEEFLEILYGANLTPKEREDLKIAVSELSANAMEWGNRSDPNRRVRVSYCLFPEEFVLKIEDEGEGFEPDMVPDPSTDPMAAMSVRSDQGKRAGGYGLHIVRRVMDSVVYNETGNVVLLTKRLGTETQKTSGEGS
ncbi:MAG: ATP-binding protein [Planctomycetes bacterium]|nr:ATP-binding protein [Planctomycetota bacterium]